MLAKTLDEAWRARSAEQPIEVSPTFCGDGLMLGAGTLLAGIERETGVFGCDDARLLTLLSVGYGRPIASDALRHIRRGVRCWREGDSALASMHLAHARLGKLPAPRDAARRLFLADRLMQAGAEPEVILRAAGLAAPEPGDGLFRQFAVDQPRVPAGSPDGGQWVAEFGSAIARLSEKALLGMARVAARASAPATFLTVLFTPTPTGGKGHVIKVPGHPGLTLSRGGDEALWRLTDEDAGTTTFLRDTNGVLTDPKGKVVGRLLTTGVLALDLAAVATERFKDEPKLFPAPQRDKYGHGEDSDARAYEDQVKALANPGAPTPSGLAVVLPNPLVKSGETFFDDCQRSTGAMIEAKGPGYDDLLKRADASSFRPGVESKLLGQALSQVQAAGDRPVIWFFAEADTAAAARELFDGSDKGRNRIKIVALPYAGRRR